MKIKLLTLVFLINWVLPLISEAQCKVSKESLGNNVVSYDGENIPIYEDSSNGLQSAYVSMIVWKKGDDVNSLKFFVHVSVYTSGSKTGLSPNVVKFRFSGGQVLEYNTDDIISSLRKGIGMKEGLFPLGPNDIKVFQTTDLLSIKVVDNKSNSIIMGHPHNDEVQKQSNCIQEATY
jgi:hypothetical protein